MFPSRARTEARHCSALPMTKKDACVAEATGATVAGPFVTTTGDLDFAGAQTREGSTFAAGLGPEAIASAAPI